MLDQASLVDRFLAAVASGDTDALAAILHPDFEIIEADSLPYAGTYRGLSGWLDLVAAVGRAWRGVAIELVEHPWVTNDDVFALFRMQGKARNTGIQFSTLILERWQIVDHRVRKITPFYFDTGALMSICRADKG